MCGLAGVWGETDEAVVREMMDRLAHRGPDDEGVLRTEHGTLGHRRLSIIDPEGGKQPIRNEERSAALIHNGEIYNHRRLRTGLQEHHEFATNSDGEAALHLYEERGPDMARALDGMFAVAIADGPDLFLARDPVGIKPLYYAVEPTGNGADRWHFASELKALTQVPVEVREFPPGTCYHSRTGFSRYYEVPDPTAPAASPDEWAARVRRTLEASVVKRLMSDVPLGAFLSGGLDSSVIAAIARRELGALHTFSVGVEGSRDLEAARRVAEHIGSDHHEYIFTPAEVRERLPEILYYLESFDQDLVRSAIPCYFCSRLASEYVKVILTGEGADELFAGYTYYKELADPRTLRRELRRSVTSLHNINLQRVDRLTMAHGIEGRVPFLDVRMIELGLSLPAELKLRSGPAGQPVEKWILRQACADLLPPEIVWRDKEQFDEGSGTADLMGDLTAGLFSGAQAAEYGRAHPQAQMRSPEEATYHRLLWEAYEGSPVVFGNVARWADRPDTG